MKHLGVTSPGSWALNCACTVPSCPWLGWRRGCLKSRALSCEVPGYLCFLLLLSPFLPSPASKPALFIDAQLLRGTERARNVRSGKLWKLCFFSFFFFLPSWLLSPVFFQGVTLRGIMFQIKQARAGSFLTPIACMGGLCCWASNYSRSVVMCRGPEVSIRTWVNTCPYRVQN